MRPPRRILTTQMLARIDWTATPFSSLACVTTDTVTRSIGVSAGRLRYPALVPWSTWLAILVSSRKAPQNSSFSFARSSRYAMRPPAETAGRLARRVIGRLQCHAVLAWRNEGRRTRKEPPGRVHIGEKTGHLSCCLRVALYHRRIRRNVLNVRAAGSHNCPRTPIHASASYGMPPAYVICLFLAWQQLLLALSVPVHCR